MSLEAQGLTYLSVSRLAALSRACPSPTPGALAACGYFLKGFISLGLAARLTSEDGGCSGMRSRISLAAQVGAGRGGGLGRVTPAARQDCRLLPFCWRMGRNLHPGEEKSFHNSHSSFQQRLLPGSLCLVLLGCWDLPYPPTHPSSFLHLSVCRA